MDNEQVQSNVDDQTLTTSDTSELNTETPSQSDSETHEEEIAIQTSDESQDQENVVDIEKERISKKMSKLEKEKNEADAQYRAMLAQLDTLFREDPGAFDRFNEVRRGMGLSEIGAYEELYGKPNSRETQVNESERPLSRAEVQNIIYETRMKDDGYEKLFSQYPDIDFRKLTPEQQKEKEIGGLYQYLESTAQQIMRIKQVDFGTALASAYRALPDVQAKMEKANKEAGELAGVNTALSRGVGVMSGTKSTTSKQGQPTLSEDELQVMKKLGLDKDNSLKEAFMSHR